MARCFGAIEDHDLDLVLVPLAYPHEAWHCVSACRAIMGDEYNEYGLPRIEFAVKFRLICDHRIDVVHRASPCHSLAYAKSENRPGLLSTFTGPFSRALHLERHPGTQIGAQ